MPGSAQISGKKLCVTDSPYSLILVKNLIIVILYYFRVDCVLAFMI